MAAISQAIFSTAVSWVKSFVFFIKISLKFIPELPIDNNSALVKIMAWHQIGGKPLSEPMLTWTTAAYMRYLGEMI